MIQTTLDALESNVKKGDIGQGTTKSEMVNVNKCVERSLDSIERHEDAHNRMNDSKDVTEMAEMRTCMSPSDLRTTGRKSWDS